MRRAALFAVVVASLLGVAGYYGVHWIPFDTSYGMAAQFDSVPPNDKAFAEWIRSQPGVWLAHVKREQVGSRWRVETIFGMTRNGWSQPPLPHLDAAAAKLGYCGPDGPFRHAP